MNALLGFWISLSFLCKLLIVFSGYVLSQVIFGGVYTAMYRRNHQNFSFHSEIQATRNSEIGQNLKAEITTLSNEITAVDDLIAAIPNYPDVTEKIRSTGMVESPRYKFVIRVDAIVAGAGGSPPVFVYVEAFDLAGRSVFWKSISVPFTTMDLDIPQLLKEHCESMKEQLKAAIQDSRDMDRKAYVKPTWTYWDFLYYSAICQTTVGFGDILPNSTTIRLITVFQILLGYLMLVVVLNLVVSSL